MTTTLRARSLPYRPPLPANEAICTRCGIRFRMSRPTRDGWHTECRDCR